MRYVLSQQLYYTNVLSIQYTLNLEFVWLSGHLVHKAEVLRRSMKALV